MRRRSHCSRCGLIAPPQMLLVRLFFTLGNITSGSGVNRQRLAAAAPPSGSGPRANAALQLLRLLRLHSQRYLRLRERLAELAVPAREPHDKGADAPGGAAQDVTEAEDLLAKLLRVVANVAIDEDAGHMIANDAEIQSLVTLLGAPTTAPFAHSARFALSLLMCVKQSVGRAPRDRSCC